MTKVEKDLIKTLREVLEAIENETRSSGALNNVNEELVVKG